MPNSNINRMKRMPRGQGGQSYDYEQKDGIFGASTSNPDIAIMATAKDAIQSKLSASQKGYYVDPFVPYLSGSASRSRSGSNARSGIIVKSSDSSRFAAPNIGNSSGIEIGHRRQQQEDASHTRMRRRKINSQMQQSSASSVQQQQQQQQQHPLIRRGTHARVCLVDHAISTFLHLCSQNNRNLHRGRDDVNVNVNVQDEQDEKERAVQIVILGSGRDTTYLRSQCGLLHDKFKKDEDNNDYDDDDGSVRKGKRRKGKVRAKWFEVDHPSVIQTKFELLQSCDLFDFDHEAVVHVHDVKGDEDDEDDGTSTSQQSYRIIPKRIRTTTQPQPHPHPSTSTTNSTLNEHECECEDNNNDNDLEPYNLISYNLQTPTAPHSLFAHLTAHHDFQTCLPTLFIMECVQMYLPECTSRNIWRGVQEICDRPFVALFDLILKGDAFGDVMVQNLTRAGIIRTRTRPRSRPQPGNRHHLSSSFGNDNDCGNGHEHGNPDMNMNKSESEVMSMLKCKTLEEQVAKLKQSGGFKYVTGCDFWNAREMIMTDEEKRRANRSEMLDEVEELILIMQHYVFVVAAGSEDGSDDGDTKCAFNIGTDGHGGGEGAGAGTSKNATAATKQLYHRDSDIAQAYCSVDEENLFGFERRKCTISTAELTLEEE